MAQLSFTKQETSRGELKLWSWDSVAGLLFVRDALEQWQ